MRHCLAPISNFRDFLGGPPVSRTYAFSSYNRTSSFVDLHSLTRWRISASSSSRTSKIAWDVADCRTNQPQGNFFLDWGYTISMRRTIAALLAALFSFSLIAPALFASSAGPNLPACCRRDGKHHCSMNAGGAQSSSGPALRSSKCSFFPCAHAVPANQTAGLPGVSGFHLVGFASNRSGGPRTQLRCRLSYDQSGQKRGPPALFS